MIKFMVSYRRINLLVKVITGISLSAIINMAMLYTMVPPPNPLTILIR